MTVKNTGLFNFDSVELLKQFEIIQADFFTLCNVDCQVEQFNCPITHTPMLDPVLAEDGFTYSQNALELWFNSLESCHPPKEITSPMTGLVMSKNYLPNHDIRKAFEEFVTKFLSLKESIVNGSLAIQLGDNKKINLSEETLKSTLNSSMRGDTSTRQDDLSELREAFAKLDRLREVLHETMDGWSPPAINVVGTRSTGKSSVLERLAMMPLFPRDPSICTRLPIHVRLRQCDMSAAKATLVVENVQTGQPESEPRLIPIQSGSSSVLKTMTELIREENSSIGGICATKRIILHVYHPNVPTIDLIDNPGLEATPEEDREATKQVMDRQVEFDKSSGDNSIYLLIIRAGIQFAVSGDLGAAFISEHNLHEKTLGVFTQCDGLHPRLYKKLRGVVENPGHDKSVHCGLGWVATMSSNEFEDMDGPERLQKQMISEVEFFQDHEDLRALVDSNMATITSLVSRVKSSYMKYLNETWMPKTLRKLQEKIQDAKYEEIKICGRRLPFESIGRDKAAQKEVRTRLEHSLNGVESKYLTELIKDLRIAIDSTLKGMCMESISLNEMEGHIQKQKCLLMEQITGVIESLENHWYEGVEDILTMDSKIEFNESSGLFNYKLVAKGSSMIWEFFSGKPKNDACKEVQSVARVNLNQYPKFVERLMLKQKLRLKECSEKLATELSRLQDAAFDITSPYVTITPDNGCLHAKFDIDSNIGEKILTLIMMHGPSVRSVKGLEIDMSVGDDQELCSLDRNRCHDIIKSLEEARSGVCKDFNIDQEKLREILAEDPYFDPT